MKTILVFLTIILGTTAQAEMPRLVECTNPDGNGKLIFHSFEFRKSNQDIFPARYDIRVFAALLTPSENPDELVSPEDPILPQEIILDKTYSGSVDVNNANLIYFTKSGFIRIDRTSPLSDFMMTFQLPGQGNDSSQFVQNCRLPQPRIGVGN